GPALRLGLVRVLQRPGRERVGRPADPATWLINPGLRVVELLAELPVVAERVGHAAGSPAVLVVDSGHGSRPGDDGTLESGIGVGDGQDHPDGGVRARVHPGFALD